MSTHTIRLICLSLSAALFGCRTDGDLYRHEVAEIAANHESELARFQQAQADFARRYPMPRQFEFQHDGTIIVEEAVLEGHPGREFLRVGFTYVNTTGHAIDEARLTLTMRDPETDLEWSEEMSLRLPLALHFTSDSSYTTRFEIPTRGIHLHPHWEWKIRARAVLHIGGSSPAG